ncbi:DUF418 domain-containing protein [Nocardiopsis chromatogenes]|uniref:DUF418 domain-containing protein n=1 Tax=Nocardiopsis chromatogenes TaxID=280239 RepID=UPI00034B9D14|nr:DUF418 domain-containing protein [Nocardiopsis chromatogenes]
MSMPSSPAPGAVPAARRSLAPDLARGLMLLVIATVHAHMFRIAVGGSAGYSLDGPLDTAATAAMALFAENRGYPMFAALFGYGLARIALRRTAEGRPWPWVRRLLRRRGRWMVAIGLAHGILIFFGDIIAVYGLIALLFAGVMRWSDRRLLATAFVWGSVGTLVYSAVNGLAMDAAAEGGTVASPVEDLLMRVVMLPFFLPLLIIISVFPFLAGVWAARRRLLEEPGRHRAFLTRLAAIGIPAAVVGGVPYMLINIEVWQPAAPVVAGVFWLHMLVGYAGGLGYAALIALIALRAGDRRGPVVTALAATGQRSMTCYLLQSVAWLVLMPAYTLGLAAELGDAAAVGIGAAVWLATVALADLMRRAGFKQGPAEWFLRRMTYGNPAKEKTKGEVPATA